MIDTPEHDVVDTRTTLFSCFSWHNISNNDAKISNNPQTSKKKYTKRTVPFVYFCVQKRDAVRHLLMFFGLPVISQSVRQAYLIVACPLSTP